MLAKVGIGMMPQASVYSPFHEGVVGGTRIQPVPR